MTRRLPFVVVAVIATLLVGCGSNTASPSATPTPSAKASSGGALSLSGAGSTFDYPFFSKAFSVYSNQHRVSVNYQPIGSGAGIEQFTRQTVDFGATDVPMDHSELAAAHRTVGAVDQIPVTLGGVSMAYNLPGIKSGLKLDGPTIAGIYLGQIEKWTDPRIKRLNPGIKLPDMQITVTHRSDASGTSYIFSDYLSSVSPTWKHKVGAGKLPNWPVGVGGKGNPGVAAIVKQTPGAIGYVELAYVLQNGMTQAKVKNKAGSFQYPTLQTVGAAASQFPHVSAQHFSIVNAAGARSYPIAGYSWVLLPAHPRNANKGKVLASLMGWLTTAGQRYARRLDYVPLPKNVQQLATRKINGITVK